MDIIWYENRLCPDNMRISLCDRDRDFARLTVSEWDAEAVLDTKGVRV